MEYFKKPVWLLLHWENIFDIKNHTSFDIVYSTKLTIFIKLRKCSLLGIDNVCRQKSLHIFAPTGGIVYRVTFILHCMITFCITNKSR